MPTETEHHITSSVEEDESLIPEPSSTTKESLLLEHTTNQELSNANQILTKVELDFAFVSEKFMNLTLLSMQLSTKEHNFEQHPSDDDSAHKTLEFDLLSTILNSEAKELESILGYLQTDIQTARDQPLYDLEEKLNDTQQSITQLLAQVVQMKKQSSNYGEFVDLDTHIKMQTTDQQRNVLRMLEKSLAKEIELEKKLTESKTNEDELKMKLYSSEQDVVYMEEVIEDVYSKSLEGDNAVEVFKGMLKEMYGKVQTLQFNLNGCLKREERLKSELVASQVNMEKFEKHLRDSDIQLERAVAAVEASKEKQSLLYSTVSDMEDVIDDLKAKVSKAESRAECTEEKLIVVSESNEELNEEVKFVRGRLKEAEERKVRTANDIVVHDKIVKKLVMQLAKERERLHKQITNLSRENVVLMMKLKKISNMESSYASEASPKSNHNVTSCDQERRPQATITSLTNLEEEGLESKTDIGSVRRSDVGALRCNKKIIYAISAILTWSLAYFVGYFVSQENM